MDRLNRLVLECSQSVSDLCLLGAKYDTDKSPYNSGAHRHPYTAVYDLLFSTRRYEPLLFAEIGVLNNSSMKMWHSYFPNAAFCGFDANKDLLAKAREEKLSRTAYYEMDVSKIESIESGFQQLKQKCDIIIDDSTHLFEHQVAIVPIALKYCKCGGAIIVEDVFRQWSEKRYVDALSRYYPYFQSGYFVETNHVYRRSEGVVEPYYDNDKLLVLFRNDKAI